MSRRRREGFVLDEAIRDPGFTPGRDDVPALLERLAHADPLAAWPRDANDAARSELRRQGARVAFERAMIACVVFVDVHRAKGP